MHSPDFYNPYDLGITLGAEGVCLAVILVLLIALLTENRIKRTEHNYFVYTVLATFFSVVCDFAGTMLQGEPYYIPAMRLLFSGNYVLLSLAIMFFSLYQYSEMKQKVFVSDIVAYGAVLFSVSACVIWLVGVYLDDPWFINFTSSGYFVRVSGYMVSGVIPIIVLLFNFFLVLSCREKISRSELFAWCSYEIFLPLAFIANLFGIYYDCFTDAAITLSVVLMYTNIHVAHARESIVTENELRKSQMQLMVSQIQPHFMYNSLNSIYALIDKDPELAQDAVSTFSDYLRRNINSLKNENPVAFREELEHTKAYLRLEQIRFGNKLKVEFDIKATTFAVPPLSLQPLVENSIKHGISKRPEGGMVKISSAEKENEYTVTVVDNGVGFVAGEFKDSASTHIGIFNVRARIKVMCGGELSVKSMPGEGTVCVISIPK